MIPKQTLENYPVFGDTATKVQPEDAKMSAGFQQSDVLPAEWVNWAWNKNSKGIREANMGIDSMESELISILTAAGITPAEATEDQVLTAIQQLITNKTGTLANLTTTAKNTLVAAINEAITKIGSLPSLPTTEKTNLVGAISELDGDIATAVNNRGRFFTVTCNTGADVQQKEIGLNGYTVLPGDTIGVTFTYANGYGESTAATPTYPQLLINTGSGTILLEIADSRGHSAGKGCWNAGDYIELKIVSATKCCIVNSDVRESVQGESGYTIYSNDFIEQWYYKNILKSTTSTINFLINFKTRVTNISVMNNGGVIYDNRYNFAYDVNNVNLNSLKINNGIEYGNSHNFYMKVEGF